MAYKTLLVYADDTPSLELRLNVAFEVAASEGGYVLCAATSGISRLIFQGGDGADLGMAECLNTMREIARTQAERALHRLEALARSRSVPIEKRLIEDEPISGLTSLACYSDLVVLSQTNRNDPESSSIVYLPEYVALGSGRPVLVVPHSRSLPSIGKRILIGWNSSASAARALACALPFLKRADSIDVAVFNRDPEPDADQSRFHSDFSHYFSHHALDVNLWIEKTEQEIGTALLGMAHEKKADMLVMGCYGHTRFREILLGGATRTVLEKMTIPVLMAH